MSVIDSQWAEVAEERKIEGVPEGWRLVALRRVKSYEFFVNASGLPERYSNLQSLQSNFVYPVIERIPRPKKRVMIAEFIVPEKACTGIYPVVTAEFHMQDDSRETIGDCTFRIEERDQPLKEGQRPKRQVLLAEAEVPPDFRIEDGGAIVAYRSGTGISLDIHRFNAEVFRIEERDA